MKHGGAVKSAAQLEPSSGGSDSKEQASKEQGIGQSLFAGTAPDLTWAVTLPWFAKHTSLPIVLKGVQTHEDAYLASLHPQVKGIILSNHGGRAMDTAPPAIHTLCEIRKYCPEVLGKLEVYVDGGIKRGTDIVKALCLGARAVGLGRAPLWGLGVGGREGVERVFESKSTLFVPETLSLTYAKILASLTLQNTLMSTVLKAEVETCMRLLGVERIDQLGPQHVSLSFPSLRLNNLFVNLMLTPPNQVNTRALEREIYDGPAGFGNLGLTNQQTAPSARSKL